MEPGWSTTTETLGPCALQENYVDASVTFFEMSENLALQKIAPLIHEIRGERVILDSDLARIYGVQVKALNQAVKRNLKRFPEDFAFRLTQSEFQSLRSQIVTIDKEPANRSQFVTGSQKHRNPAYAPQYARLRRRRQRGTSLHYAAFAPSANAFCRAK